MVDSAFFYSQEIHQNHHHNHGHRHQKWHSNSAREEFWANSMRWFRLGQSPEQANMLFSSKRRFMALKMLQCCGDDGDESCLAIGLFWGSSTPSLQEKSISAYLRDCPPSIRHVGSGWLAFWAVLGGHFRQRRPWWRGPLLAVGSWLFGT